MKNLAENMEIVWKGIAELTPYENNPRKNDEAVPYVARSIERFGWKQPLVIDGDGVIVCGHTRYKAAKSLGLEKVPCVIADDLTEDEIKAYRLADNKVGELAIWDFEKQAVELDELEDIDMQDFGFFIVGEESDFDDIFEEGEEQKPQAKEEKEEAQTEYKVVVKLGTKEEADELVKELLAQGYECEVEE